MDVCVIPLIYSNDLHTGAHRVCLYIYICIYKYDWINKQHFWNTLKTILIIRYAINRKYTYWILRPISFLLLCGELIHALNLLLWYISFYLYISFYINIICPYYSDKDVFCLSIFFSPSSYKLDTGLVFV